MRDRPAAGADEQPLLRQLVEVAPDGRRRHRHRNGRFVDVQLAVDREQFEQLAPPLLLGHAQQPFFDWNSGTAPRPAGTDAASGGRSADPGRVRGVDRIAAASRKAWHGQAAHVTRHSAADLWTRQAFRVDTALTHLDGFRILSAISAHLRSSRMVRHP